MTNQNVLVYSSETKIKLFYELYLSMQPSQGFYFNSSVVSMFLLSVPGAHIGLNFEQWACFFLSFAWAESVQGGLSSSLTNSFLAGGACSCLMKMSHCSLILCLGSLFPEDNSEWVVILSSFLEESMDTHVHTQANTGSIHLFKIFFYFQCLIIFNCWSENLSRDITHYFNDNAF